MRNRKLFMETFVDCLTMEETISQIQHLIQTNGYYQHVVLNAGKINLLNQSRELREIVNECDLINADGQSIVWAGRYLGIDIPERVTGIDLFERLVALAAEKNYSVYYLGASQEVVQQVVAIHQKNYPQLKIAGYHHGYFCEDEIPYIVQNIRSSQPTFLFVAFSSPKKEYFVNKYKNTLQVPFTMGIGGSFDVIAGKTKRAPLILQKIGMEWFYRFVQEPRRMFQRYIIGNISFIRTVQQEKRRMKRAEK